MIQAIKDEVTLFQAQSAALGIPVWIYYAGVPLLSVFVFRGVWRDAKPGLPYCKERGWTDGNRRYQPDLSGAHVPGVPIGTSLGVAAVVTIFQFDLGIEMLGVNFSSGIASFPLLAIPFFVLAG